MTGKLLFQIFRKLQKAGLFLGTSAIIQEPQISVKILYLSIEKMKIQWYNIMTKT